MKMFSWLTWDYRFSRYISPAKLSGCLHEKTRTGTSFISRWLFYFVSRLHYDWVTSYLKIWRLHFMLIKYTCDSKSQTLRMATCSSLLADRFHNIMGSCSRLHDTVARFRTGVKFSPRHDILWWYHVDKYKAIRGNWSDLALARKSPQCHVNTP